MKTLVMTGIKFTAAFGLAALVSSQPAQADASVPAGALNPAQTQILHEFKMLQGDVLGHGGHGGPMCDDSAGCVETTTLDVQRSSKGNAGKAARQVHISGTLTRQVSAGSSLQARASSASGQLKVDRGQGDVANVVFTDVSRSASDRCFLPTGGSMTRTDSQGERHTLAFSATCGQATLDGAAVTLPQPPFHGHGGHGHDGNDGHCGAPQ